MRVLVRVDGVEAGEDHALDVFEAGQGLGAGARDLGDGVADLGVGDVLDGRDEEADLAGGELGERDRLGRHDAHALDVEGLAVRHDLDLHALAQASVDDAGEHDDAAVGIEPGVEDEGLQRRVGISTRRRQTMHDGLEDVGNALAGLGGDGERVVGGKADGLLDHLAGALDVGGGQVDLVDDGDDFEAVVDGEIGVGQGLRLDALRCVDDQQRALAGGERARDLVAEVDVAGRVDEVELVGLAVCAWYIMRTVWALMVMPRSRSRSMASSTWACISRAVRRAGELQQAVGERGLCRGRCAR